MGKLYKHFCTYYTRTSTRHVLLVRCRRKHCLHFYVFRYANLIRLLVGYGAPLLVVAITLAVAYIAFEGDAYSHGSEGDNPVCWLQEDTFIWAFTGPAAAVILFNTFVIFRALRVTTEAQRRKSDTVLEEVAGNAKSCLILTFLLGLTWAVGFLIQGPMATYTAFAFVLLNGSIGIFLFIHTVLLNEMLATEMQIWLGIKSRRNYRLAFGGSRSNAIRRESAPNVKKPASIEVVERGVARRRKPADTGWRLDDDERTPSSPESTSLGSSSSSSASSSGGSSSRQSHPYYISHQKINRLGAIKEEEAEERFSNSRASPAARHLQQVPRRHSNQY